MGITILRIGNRAGLIVLKNHVSHCHKRTRIDSCIIRKKYRQGENEASKVRNVHFFRSEDVGKNMLAWSAHRDEAEKKGCPTGVTRTWTAKAMSGVSP